jgi:hypothetical protein
MQRASTTFLAVSAASQRRIPSVLLSRSMATEAQITAVKPAAEGIVASPAALPSAQPVAVTRPVVVKSSSLTDRVLAFMAGLGVGGVVGYYKLTEDIWESTAEVRTRSRCCDAVGRRVFAHPPPSLLHTRVRRCAVCRRHRDQCHWHCLSQLHLISLSVALWVFVGRASCTRGWDKPRQSLAVGHRQFFFLLLLPQTPFSSSGPNVCVCLSSSWVFPFLEALCTSLFCLCASLDCSGAVL